MRQEREPRQTNNEGSTSNLFRKLGGVEFVGAPPFSLPRDSREGKEDGFEETCLVLRREHRRENREQPYRKENGHKPDGFEPFLHQERQEGDLFVNNYGGNYAHAMELNRGGVERVLKIAHLDGRVSLTNFQQSRSRAEAHGNELAAKRFLIFGDKTQKAEEENPYKRALSVPEGWRIEINDQRITEELAEGQKLTGEKLQRAFVNKFNAQLKEGLRECVWREKCSGEKDNTFRAKAIASVGYSLCSAALWVPVANINLPIGIVMYLGGTPLGFGLMNSVSKSNSIRVSRQIDHPFEYFMPPVEIDKVGRTFAYLSPVIGKGRTLVRETQEK